MAQKRETGTTISRVAAAAITVNLLLSLDASDELALCTATTRPAGQAMDSYDADAIAGCRLAADGIWELVASKAIAFRAIVYTDAAGKVTDTPVAGCFAVGVALEAAGADGDGIAVLPFAVPYSISDLAAATYVAPAGGATQDAEARASLAQLAADFADLRAKLVAAGLVKT